MRRQESASIADAASGHGFSPTRNIGDLEPIKRYLGTVGTIVIQPSLSLVNQFRRRSTSSVPLVQPIFYEEQLSYPTFVSASQQRRLSQGSL